MNITSTDLTGQQNYLDNVIPSLTDQNQSYFNVLQSDLFPDDIQRWKRRERNQREEKQQK